MMPLRNEYFAHGGETDHEQRAVAIALNPELSEPGIYQLVLASIATSALGNSRLETFLAVVVKVSQVVDVMLSKSKQAVVREAKEVAIEHLYEQAQYHRQHSE